MEKIVLLFMLFLFGMNFSVASQLESVTLEMQGFERIQVPKADTKVFSAINQDGEYVSDDDYTSIRDFEPEDDITDNKAAKSFYKFVDRVIINNKLNDYASRIAE